MAETISSRAVLGSENYRTTMTNGRSEVFCDEPLDKGGNDTAPAPRELLCMSLAACTAITLRMYAERKGWQLGKIDVHVDLVEENGVPVFQRRISWETGVDDATKERLLVVADKCPVHKLLSASNQIQTQFTA